MPVPRHWSQKRKYLQGKRGIEKLPWQLPDFIAATGIEKLRQVGRERGGEGGSTWGERSSRRVGCAGEGEGSVVLLFDALRVRCCAIHDHSLVAALLRASHQNVLNIVYFLSPLSPLSPSPPYHLPGIR